MAGGEGEEEGYPGEKPREKLWRKPKKEKEQYNASRSFEEAQDHSLANGTPKAQMILPLRSIVS